MGWGPNGFLMEIPMLAIIPMGSRKGMGSIFGQTKIFIRVISSMDLDMGEGYGNPERMEEISTRENIRMTKNRVFFYDFIKKCLILLIFLIKMY